MYISVQVIILEILLGLIFLTVLYFMLRELLKKIIRKELQPTKEHLEILASYLVQQAEEIQQTEQDLVSNPTTNVPPVASVGISPEKLVIEPVDVADEFVALKNANRINAYNIRVQKIWELYKHKKINIKQYNEELIRLKKEFGIDLDESDQEKVGEPVLTKVKPLTPNPKTTPVPSPTSIPAPDSGQKDAAAKADTPQPAAPEKSADTIEKEAPTDESEIQR